VPERCLVRWAGRHAIVTVPTEIDINNVAEISDALLAALDQGVAVLVVDMTGAAFCAAAGVHAVLRAPERAAAIPATMRLAASQWPVLRLLELTGADQLIDTYPSLDAALTRMPVCCVGAAGTADGHRTGTS
jgi:anti-sigma B factor antagonist